MQPVCNSILEASEAGFHHCCVSYASVGTQTDEPKGNTKTSRLIRVLDRSANCFQSWATKMGWILSVGTYYQILVSFCSTFDGTTIFQILLVK